MKGILIIMMGMVSVNTFSADLKLNYDCSNIDSKIKGLKLFVTVPTDKNGKIACDTEACKTTAPFSVSISTDSQKRTFGLGTKRLNRELNQYGRRLNKIEDYGILDGKMTINIYSNADFKELSLSARKGGINSAFSRKEKSLGDCQLQSTLNLETGEIIHY